MLDSFKALTLLALEPSLQLALAAGALAASAAARPWVAVSNGVRAEPATATTPAVALFEPAMHRPVAMQWQELSRIVEGGIRSARRAVDFQTAALIQVDAGEFALKAIGDDLRTIMPRLAARRGAAARSSAQRLELVAA